MLVLVLVLMMLELVLVVMLVLELVVLVLLVVRSYYLVISSCVRSSVRLRSRSNCAARGCGTSHSAVVEPLRF